MAAISIKTQLFPMRFAVKSKDPVELTVEVQNNGEKAKIISLEVFLPHVLGFDKSGLNKGLRKHVGDIKPNEIKKFIFPVYVSPIAEIGNFVAEANVLEHHEDFSQVIRVFTREFDCRLVR